MMYGPDETQNDTTFTEYFVFILDNSLIAEKLREIKHFGMHVFDNR